jgi:hypothetical protein
MFLANLGYFMENWRRVKLEASLDAIEMTASRFGWGCG